MAYSPPIGTVDLDLEGTSAPPLGTADLELGEAAPPASVLLIGETLAPTGAVAVIPAFRYVPPLGTVDLNLDGEESPPVGTVPLHLGPVLVTESQAVLTGETLAPTGAVTLQQSFPVLLVGETLAPTGALHLYVTTYGALAGETLAPTGTVTLHREFPVTLEGETQAPTGAVVITAGIVYTPPVGTVDLALTEVTAPPTGRVDLNLGPTPPEERIAAMGGETLAPTGAMTILPGAIYPLPLGTVDLNLDDDTLPPVGRVPLHIGPYVAPPASSVAIAGETQAPTGAISAIKIIRTFVAGETLAPTGAVSADYDPNLLSDVIRSAKGDWQEATGMSYAVQEAFLDTSLLQVWLSPTWQEATLQSNHTRAEWQDSPILLDGKRSTWTDALPLRAESVTAWQDSPFLNQERRAHWQDAEPLRMAQVAAYRARLTLRTQERVATWQEGAFVTHAATALYQEGLLLLCGDEVWWQEAGYPGNAPNPGPPLPIPIPWPWGSDLNLRCPWPTSPGRIHLNLGRSPCILVAEREVPYRRSYMTVNSATLVRWPDLTPLPVTAMTIETDFDSWCWALTATLSGPDAWALVQPNPLACEVQATINDQIWRFLLDVPSQSRSFNQDRVTLKGRSRSAWLHDPYTPPRNLSQTQARDMTQLAALAIENTGWSLDWQLEDWLVPAGRYTSWNTPIGALLRLANTTDDGVYTHPVDQMITLHKRWPVASWLLDGETMDLLIPDSAILSLTQSPVYTQPLNGVYVSGISHGVLALVKITGTDGALQPDEPITDELLCDEAGVAARQRGLNALSDSGAGWEMDAETLFAPSASPAFPLVPPGQIVSIAGLKGISRSCRITAQRSGDALSVRQSIGIERREVESA